MKPAGHGSGRIRPEAARRPSYLLSGLVRCACCGASYTLINKTRYGCTTPRTKGDAICSNRATIGRAEVEERVMLGLQQSLMHPDLIAAFVEEYRVAFNASAADASANLDQARRELAKTEKKIAGIVSAIEDGMYHASMKEKMAALEEERQRLTSLLASNPEPPALRLHRKGCPDHTVTA
jgi:hypothetical protein